MTDEQIIKDLQACLNFDDYGDRDCIKCSQSDWRVCRDNLMKQALDLISRQKVEIEEYREKEMTENEPMRERLIELLNVNCGYVDEVKAETLADYLLENNVVVLPCKVGDVVYTTYGGSLSEYKVMSLIRNDFWWAVLYNPYYAPEHQNEKICLNFSLGRFVFLTREEAEKALKERENGNTM